ncbi:hypothetical protein P43SY_001997 [Pythium insidiosum]|uniref:Uncharacterized protein n=1 Tax=Pythium insidiosum TaxID=114742 RepID=A0AAD5LLC5_PYTIN|nr:hypothetical protein P43SY_001997 [Pythium insidiosum]
MTTAQRAVECASGAAPAAAAAFGLLSAQPADRAPTPSQPLALVLPFVLPFCATLELDTLSLVDRESAALCEPEWRLRVLDRFGALRFATCAWRKCFKLRAYLQRRVIEHVTARVYLMNTRGETTCFPVPSGRTMMCSRERAIVYTRCERMFDLSLRINRSIQEISALIGLVSVDEARGLLNEHINLMTSVASLRSSLLFESELFQVFPAPVLLDANTLLRGTFRFPDDQFLAGDPTVMMQVWASIDGLIFRPLAPPAVVLPLSPRSPTAADEAPTLDAGPTAISPPPPPLAPPPPPPSTADADDASAPQTYRVLKLHELSGMTISIDDNTLRYRLTQDEMCLNALVSNTYLLYLFNPLQFRPMDWSYDAVLYVGDTRYALPTQREGVFLNSTTLALRVFLSYGRVGDPKSAEERATGQQSLLQDSDDEEEEDNEDDEGGVRGSESSEPLEIACSGDTEVFSFRLVARNRVSKETREIVNKAACFTLRGGSASGPAASDWSRLRNASVSPIDSLPPQLDAAATEKPERGDDPATAAHKRSTKLASSLRRERHVHLPCDAMICYCFDRDYTLQYVEFAIGFEALLHQLGVSSFLAV